MNARIYNPLNWAYWCHLQRRLAPEFSSEGENGFDAIVVYGTNKTGKPPYCIDILGENSVTSTQKSLLTAEKRVRQQGFLDFFKLGYASVSGEIRKRTFDNNKFPLINKEHWVYIAADDIGEPIGSSGCILN